MNTQPMRCKLLPLIPFVFVLAGCGGTNSDFVSVQGKVNYKGKALADATLSFIPINGTKGIGGVGKTEADGSYKVSYNRGGEGLPAGTYKIIVSQRLNPDGSPADPDLSPIESPAVEKLPSVYSSEEHTKLTKEISPSTTTYDFSLGK